MESPVTEKPETNFLNCSPTHSCQECCNTKNELRDFREEIAFLSHQVIQLMHVLCIRNCRCKRCMSFVRSSFETSFDGAFETASPTNSGYTSEDLNSSNLFDKNTQIRALAVLNDASRRCRKRIIGSVDQLLPKILAERESYAPVPTMANAQHESSNDESVYLNDVPELTNEAVVDDSERVGQHY
ncbi:unnamed protein product [Soboliphyme baturini]|uniref:Uncharacterized protein n=1 Tax=Soboliphyme baturini TaxID=241478 RepID=A0A183J7G6_9BILA|nr:unnamed protein product [Soboliphyme baturini]